MKKSVLCFGEILYDIFPSYQRLGGAPFNFAYHIERFGFACTMISRIGDDPLGHEILSFLKNGLGAETIQVDPLHATGRVLVHVDEKGVPDFDIVSDAAYDYIAFDQASRKALEQEPALIYMGTLAQRHETSRSTLRTILSQNRTARILYDMNLRQDHFSREIVEQSLKACSIVKLNDDELQACKNLLERSGPDKPFIHYLMEQYDLEWVCLTKGEKGSELFYSTEHYTIDQVPELTIVDTVGAGDAYTAILALGILNRWLPETILKRATEFSGAVCRLQGAVSEETAFYDPYLSWVKEGGNGS